MQQLCDIHRNETFRLALKAIYHNALLNELKREKKRRELHFRMLCVFYAFVVNTILFPPNSQTGHLRFLNEFNIDDALSYYFASIGVYHINSHHIGLF
jgi:hypothetical protein